MAYAAHRTPTRPATRRAPLGEAINAVLEHADIREDLGGGRILHRLSPKLSRTRRLREALGRTALRAAEVAVIYDEREGQILRVLETGPVTPVRRFDENDDRWWTGRAAAA
jgi:hypothetical protein